MSGIHNVNNLNKYSSRLTKVENNLHVLTTKMNVPFLWGAQYNKVFHVISKEIKSTSVLD